MENTNRFFSPGPKTVGADINIRLAELYGGVCSGQDDFIRLSNRDLINENLIKKIFEGQLKTGQIDQNAYFDIAKILTDAITKAIGSSSNNNSLKAYLEHNIFAFSAAKNLTELQEYKKAITNDKGEKESYNRFRDKVTTIGETFNNAYLKAEYNDVIAKTQMADKWQGLKEFEFLEYRTVGDNRVSEEHAKLDGMIFASDDPILDKIYPPNRFGCRCVMLPAKRNAKPTDKKMAEQAEKQAKIKPYFKNHVGKSQTIFKDNHPYFEALGKPDELLPEKNYNMPSIEQIYKKIESLPEYRAIIDHKAWFEKQAKNNIIELPAKDGITIQLPKMDNAHLATEVIKNADEVWSQKHNGQLQTTYIKYYRDKPYSVIVKEDKGTLKATQFANVDKTRKGILKFRKTIL